MLWIIKKILKKRNSLQKQKEDIEFQGGTEEASNADNNVAPSTEQSKTLPALRSWASETRYDFNLLKDKSERKLSKHESKIADALEKLGAYSFVDSGKLGRLIQKKPNTKIHYVLSKDPVLKDRVLLAIEITNDVLKIVNNADNPITIGDKTYQVVGAMGYQASRENNVAQNNYNDLKQAILDEVKRI